MTDLFKPTFLRVGIPHNTVRPPTIIRPPTEGGEAFRTDLVVTAATGSPPPGNPWPVNLPTYVAGDRVVVCVSCADTLAADITGVDGFTELKTSANAERGAVYQRIMDGTEGSTVDVSLAAAAQTAVAIAFVHRGLDWTVYTTDVASAFATSSVDPPQVNLSHGEGSTYDVYIFWGGVDASGQTKVDTPSTGYTELVDENTGPGDTSAGLMHKQITGATSEDPGVYVINTGSTDCVTFAIVAKAATGAVAAGDHTHVEADVTDLAHTDADAIHDNVAGEIAAITAKATPVSGDFLVIEDSEASNAKKSITLADLPATSAALDDLTDVTITGTPADNEVVAYDTGTSEFINQTAAEAGLSATGHTHTESDVTDLDHPHSVDDMSDVDTTTAAPTTGQVLKWDGSNWVPDDDDTGSGSLPTGTTAGDLAVYNGTSWVRIGAGANDTVLTADSAQTEGIKWAAGGGGGGKSYVTEPGLKPPDSAHADDDEFAYTNGTDPTTQGWSWGNQDGATADIQAGRLIIANTGSTNNSNGLFKAAPTGDFDVIVRVAGDMIGNFHGVALTMLWGTLATPTRVDMHRYITNPPLIAGARMSGYGAFSSALGTNRPYSLNVLPYLRVVWDDTAEEAAFQYSVSGLAGTWRTHVSGIAGPGTPPDFIGLAIRRESAGAITGVFDFYRVNWTSDFDVTTDD